MKVINRTLMRKSSSLNRGDIADIVDIQNEMRQLITSYDHNHKSIGESIDWITQFNLMCNVDMSTSSEFAFARVNIPLNQCLNIFVLMESTGEYVVNLDVYDESMSLVHSDSISVPFESPIERKLFEIDGLSSSDDDIFYIRLTGIGSNVVISSYGILK